MINSILLLLTCIWLFWFIHWHISTIAIVFHRRSPGWWHFGICWYHPGDLLNKNEASVELKTSNEEWFDFWARIGFLNLGGGSRSSWLESFSDLPHSQKKYIMGYVKNSVVIKYPFHGPYRFHWVVVGQIHQPIQSEKTVYWCYQFFSGPHNTQSTSRNYTPACSFSEVLDLLSNRHQTVRVYNTMSFSYHP